MGSKWTVDPETHRIDLDILGEPVWIEIKKELTEGEQRRVNTAGFRGVSGFGDKPRPGDAEKEIQIGIDWASQSYARTVAYLLDWSLTDDRGNKLSLHQARKRETIEALKPEVYEAIENAISAYIEQRDEEKKLRHGVLEQKPTSD